MQQPSYSMDELRAMAEKYRNWGRWGDDDEIGTLNFVTPEDIVAATRLVRKGKVISMCLPLDGNGPQNGRMGRYNPLHYMLRSGTDVYAEIQRGEEGPSYADDCIIMPLQSGTQWDALSHVFYDDKMYNGFDIRLCDSTGTKRNGIEKTRDRMIGRGVFLDIPRVNGVEALPSGYAIGPDELDRVAEAHGVEIGRGDFVIFRTGMLEECLEKGDWGSYCGGDAPGLSLDTAEWLYEKRVAAICSDTFGVEVRPNPTPDKAQPWHWIVIPNMGLTMGEIFLLDELAEDCAADGVYEFLFVGPSLPVTGAVGSPVNPLAIK